MFGEICASEAPPSELRRKNLRFLRFINPYKHFWQQKTGFLVLLFLFPGDCLFSCFLVNFVFSQFSWSARNPSPLGTLPARNPAPTLVRLCPEFANHSLAFWPYLPDVLSGCPCPTVSQDPCQNLIFFFSSIYFLQYILSERQEDTFWPTRSGIIFN